MSEHIRLHREHGLNPTISTCILCGESKDEIYLLGAQYKDKAPINMVMDIIPCKKCYEKYLQHGVMLIEGTDSKTIATNPKIIVLREEAFIRLFKGVNVPERRIMIAETLVFDYINKQVKDYNHG